jgi:mRNA-degrading endonuclease RelE of RelBE toxin-antitoxin system
MNNLDHKACQQIHFDKRMKQRLGIDFNRHDTYELIIKINSDKQDGSISFYKKANKYRQWWKGKINDSTVYFLYDKQTKRIVTVITEEPK